MNKRVAKPKLPLIPDGNLSEAQMDAYLREHHDEVAERLRDGKAALDRGDAVEVKSLEHLLAGIHKRTQRAR
ncbi:MAG: hypothetical protein WDN03_11415 [Rhizomicrobium sp.]